MGKGRIAYFIRTSVTILAGLVRIAASLLFVWASKTLVDIATGVSGKDLTLFITLFVSSLAVNMAVGVFISYWENLNRAKTTVILKRILFEKVLKSRWTGRETFSSGDISSRLQEDIRIITDLLCTTIPAIVITSCQFVAATIYLLHLAPELYWCLLLLMVVAILGSKMFFKTLRRLSDQFRKKEADIQQHIQENTLNRILSLTLFGADRILTGLDNLQRDIMNVTTSRLNYNALARGFMAFGFIGGYCAAFFWGIFGIKNGTVTYGMMTAFLQLVNQIQSPMANLSAQIPAIIRGFSSKDRIMEIMHLPQEDYSEDIAIPSAPTVSLQDISFAYTDAGEGTGGKLLFDHFSYDFPAGGMTVVTGPTGSGKSTLTRLILALLAPSSGHIFFNCDDGRCLESTPATRCNIMYVPQGNSLVSGTIRENMLLVKPDASDNEIFHTLHIAAADFVEQLPCGLDTKCGESGSGLSEGQCQRIAIARALLHNGCILILDEASSALDTETERLFLERMVKEYRGRKTIIFISHRDVISSSADNLLKL